jgi:exopolysaccharide biosynthesis polyprenyl glycosylphosphotransferase
MARTPARIETSVTVGAERALGRLQLVLDTVTIAVSMPCAARLHALLRPVVPALRAATHFHDHALLVYAVLPLWLALIVTFRVQLAVAERLGQAELLTRMIKLHVAGLAGLALLQFITQSVINRSLVGLFMLCTFTFMYVQRSALIAWTRFQHVRSGAQTRILLVGQASGRMLELVAAAERAREPPRFLGYLATANDRGEPTDTASHAPTLMRLGDLNDLPSILHEQAVDHVLFFPPTHQPERLRAELLACEEVGVPASFSVDLVQLAEAAPRVTSQYDHAFVTFQLAPKPTEALVIKHTLDTVCAALLLLLSFPLWLTIAIAIRITMSRPVLFVQPRAGLHGRPFRMLKFRTMREGAEDEQVTLAGANEMSGPVFKLRADPRVTPLGRFLRRTSLDELPQLLNVLTGSMSLVGPRPLPLPEQAAIHGWQRRRLTMKPGLTCLWQVSGRNNVDFVQWMLLDLQYIEEWSLWLDLLLLLKTIPVLLFGRGAS